MQNTFLPPLSNTARTGPGSAVASPEPVGPVSGLTTHCSAASSNARRSSRRSARLSELWPWGRSMAMVSRPTSRVTETNSMAPTLPGARGRGARMRGASLRARIPRRKKEGASRGARIPRRKKTSSGQKDVPNHVFLSTGRLSARRAPPGGATCADAKRALPGDAPDRSLPDAKRAPPDGDALHDVPRRNRPEGLRRWSSPRGPRTAGTPRPAWPRGRAGPGCRRSCRRPVRCR